MSQIIFECDITEFAVIPDENYQKVLFCLNDKSLIISFMDDQDNILTQIINPPIPTVQGERLSHEIKLVLMNGKVTLNGKGYNELNPFERIIFNTLIIQEREAINELLNI